MQWKYSDYLLHWSHQSLHIQSTLFLIHHFLDCPMEIENPSFSQHFLLIPIIHQIDFQNRILIIFIIIIIIINKNSIQSILQIFLLIIIINIIINIIIIIIVVLFVLMFLMILFLEDFLISILFLDLILARNLWFWLLDSFLESWLDRLLLRKRESWL